MNTMLWIALIVSLMGNAVIGYLFWRAVTQNNLQKDKDDDWHYYYDMYGGRTKVRDK